MSHVGLFVQRAHPLQDAVWWSVEAHSDATPEERSALAAAPETAWHGPDAKQKAEALLRRLRSEP